MKLRGAAWFSAREVEERGGGSGTCESDAPRVEAGSGQRSAHLIWRQGREIGH
jgi:hypothetical protein